MTSLKRLVDVFVATVAIVVTLPVIVIALLAVWLADFRHPVYVSLRVKGPRSTFPMYKLRTMVPGADLRGGASTAGNDRRLTAVGRVLRALKIDELPQLWNVIIGDMSLVGPRAQVVQGAILYTREENRLFEKRPGITDFASIVFADEGNILAAHQDPDAAYDSLIRPWKSRLGLAYVEHGRLWVDAAIVGLTVVALFSKRLARRGVQAILVRLGVEESLVRVAGREAGLEPAPPPGGLVPATNGPYLPLSLPERAPWLRELEQLRRGPIIALHMGLVVVSALSAWWLKYDRRLGPSELALMYESLPWLVATRGLTFMPFRLYQGLWRYTGLYDLQALIGGVVASSIVFYVLARFMFVGYPGSVMVIDAMVLLFLLGGIRMGRRMYSEFGSWAPGTVDVLIYGAGAAGERLARSMRADRSGGYRPIGFIDDDPTKIGLRIHSVPVLGGRKHLESILNVTSAREIVVTIAEAEEALRSVTDLLDDRRIDVRDSGVLVERTQESRPRAMSESAPVPAPATLATIVPAEGDSLSHQGMSGACPKCNAPHLQRSHARTYFEQARKGWSPKRVFRCHACGWRGWLVPAQLVVVPGAPVSDPDRSAANLDELDDAIADLMKRTPPERTTR